MGRPKEELGDTANTLRTQAMKMPFLPNSKVSWVISNV